ncbi:MAG: CRTAC1 family protein [Sandaracinaceae bacterium]
MPYPVFVNRAPISPIGAAFAVLACWSLACGSPTPPPPVDAGSGEDAFTPPPTPDAGPAYVRRPPPDAVTVAELAGVEVEVPDALFDHLPDRMGGGVCPLDLDGVPPMDLAFALRTGVRLYAASAPLAYVDVTEAYALDADSAMGCLAFDAEGDGDTDLLVTDRGAIRLFEREGGFFTERTERLGLTLDPRDVYTSAAAGDVDGDGDIDLLVAGNIRYDTANFDALCEPYCGSMLTIHDAIPNLLLARDGDGYEDVTWELAPELTVAEMTLVVAITDLNADDAVDLYVGNDLGGTYHDRALSREADGVYRDHYLRIGLGHDARGFGNCTMGFSSADVDGDGRIDHAVTSFANDPTTLFLCGDDGWCEPQRAEVSGTDATRASFRWGAMLVDLDLDGRPELFEATGHIFSDAELESSGELRDQPANLMWNVDGAFEPVEASAEDGRATPRSTRGVAYTDVDLDGRPDVVLAPAVGRPAILRNTWESAGRALWVSLRGRAPNADALGARVRVHTSEGVLVQDRRAGEGYLGSFDPRLVFGVPRGRPVDVEVRWPSGETSWTRDVRGGDVTIRE